MRPFRVSLDPVAGMILISYIIFLFVCLVEAEIEGDRLKQKLELLQKSCEGK